MRIVHPDVLEGSISLGDQVFPIHGGVVEIPDELRNDIEIAGALPADDMKVTTTEPAPDPHAAHAAEFAAAAERLSKATVPEVQAMIAGITEPKTLEDIRAAELSVKSRKGVLDALDARKSEIALAEEVRRSSAAAAGAGAGQGQQEQGQ